jgi:hypothetical protein
LLPHQCPNRNVPQCYWQDWRCSAVLHAFAGTTAGSTLLLRLRKSHNKALGFTVPQSLLIST